ncbi:MAG: ACP S-malonyltransferase [Acholeplasmataceae bacterium]|nr:ACP S-malonyltransferase [Acholeplasmataceae bacterium]
MKKLALVFAGQGSQYAGMGIDLVDAFLELKEKEKKASDFLGFDVREILLSTDGKINETEFTQGLVLLTSIYAYEIFKTLNVKVSAVTGFSLGEYSALYAANVFDFEHIMRIIQKRSEFMKACSLKYPGKMAAVIGLSKDIVEKICQESSEKGIVVAANYNSPIQIVISGEEQAVIYASEKAKEAGAKRVMMLNVSGAFHSPLMKEAGENLYDFLRNLTYNAPKFPIYMNTTAKPLIQDNLYQEMEKQIQSSVYFEQTIEQMVQDGVTHIIEIGPGTVLSGLIKKININIEVSHFGKLNDLEELKGWLNEHGFSK